MRRQRWRCLLRGWKKSADEKLGSLPATTLIPPNIEESAPSTRPDFPLLPEYPTRKSLDNLWEESHGVANNARPINQTCKMMHVMHEKKTESPMEPPQRFSTTGTICSMSSNSFSVSSLPHGADRGKFFPLKMRHCLIVLLNDYVIDPNIRLLDRSLSSIHFRCCWIAVSTSVWLTVPNDKIIKTEDRIESLPLWIGRASSGLN